MYCNCFPLFQASSLVITGDAVQEESSRLLESALETEGTTNELDQIRLGKYLG